jgi:hypothetical protein
MISAALKGKPFEMRDNDQFLTEMINITRHHFRGCPEYRRISKGWEEIDRIEKLPFVHVGLFKRVLLRTEGDGIEHGRLLHSSSTSGTGASQIALDRQSSELHKSSVQAILRDFVGDLAAPLLLLDRGESLRHREVSARMAAGLSLLSISTSMHMVLEGEQDSIDWSLVERVLASTENVFVYGFTSLLWKAWAMGRIPQSLRNLLLQKRGCFFHSGGWKKLQDEKVGNEQFDAALLCTVGPGSRVIDFYGLVEQVGIIYPLCPFGFRHVPVWAEALVRDPLTHDVCIDRPGQLQLMNTLAWGAPYHNVLTEDLARLVPGSCPCGRSGNRFVLIGRMPKVELRGCANV